MLCATTWGLIDCCVQITGSQVSFAKQCNNCQFTFKMYKKYQNHLYTTLIYSRKSLLSKSLYILSESHIWVDMFWQKELLVATKLATATGGH